MPSAALLLEVSADWLLEVLFFGGILPAVLAVSVYLLVLRGHTWLGGAAGPAASALGLATGFFAGAILLDLAPWMPTAPWQRLPSLAWVAAAVACVEAIPRFAGRMRWPARAALALIVAWLLLPIEDPDLARANWLGGLAVSILLGWLVLEALAVRLPPVALTSVLAILAVASAVVIESAGFGRLALMSGVLAAPFGGCALAFWRWEEEGAFQGLIPGAAVLFPGLLLHGHFHNYMDVPTTSFLLILLTPPALLAVTLLPFSERAWRLRLLLQTLAVLVPPGIAIAQAPWQ